MELKWENYGAVADALMEKYPETDRINIDNNKLVELVNSLDNFKDTNVPEDKDLIKAVHYAWLELDD